MPGPEAHFDLFLSYASHDRVEARRFCGWLKAAGLRVWFDEEQVPAGELPTSSVAHGLRSSERLLAWVTRPYLRRDYTNWELAVFAAKPGATGRILAVLVEPFDVVTLGPHLARGSAVPADLTPPERLWRVVATCRGGDPGHRGRWHAEGTRLIGDEGAPTGPADAVTRIQAYEARLAAASEPEQEARSIRVFVSNQGLQYGKAFAVPPQAPVALLLADIRAALDMIGAPIRLEFEGRRIEPTSSLAAAGVSDNATLALGVDIVDGRGGVTTIRGSEPVTDWEARLRVALSGGA